MGRRFSTAFPRPPVASASLLALVLVLGACQMTQGAGEVAAPTAADAAQTAGPGQRVIERDAEAPEVFQVQETGLWDGRPSLGGVWVAHPTARDPERVLIRNTRTGATVIGALFRRERENPGPRFQVSSEAANALGILAGAPTEIQVTALRLQRVEMEIDPAPEPQTAAAETLDLTPVEPPTDTAAAASTPDAAPDGQVAVTDEAPQRHRLRDFFRRRPATDEAEAIAETPLEPATGVATAAAAAPAAPAAAVTDTATPAIVEAPRPRRSFFDLFRRRTPDTDTTLIPLPDATGTPTAAATQPLQATGTQPLPQQPAAAASQPVARIDRPFVQIGIFSVEQNAENARAQMRQAGLAAEIRRGRAGENQFWRVVVGPASSTAERAQFLQRVRALGFADAYAVQR